MIHRSMETKSQSTLIFTTRAAMRASRGAVRMPLPTRSSITNKDDLPGRGNQAGKRTDERRDGISDHHQQLAFPKFIGQYSTEQFQKGSGGFGDAFNPLPITGLRIQGSHKDRYKRIDISLATSVKRLTSPSITTFRDNLTSGFF